VLALVFPALTVLLLVATIATGFGRAWGALLIALFGIGMLVWFAIYSLSLRPGASGLEAWVWICFVGGTAIEIAVAVGLAGRGRVASTDALRFAGVVVGMPATLFSALVAYIIFAGVVIVI
jgi:hypothetical protein